MNPDFRIADHSDINEILRMMAEFNAIDSYPFDKELTFKNLVHFLGHKELGRLWVIADQGKTIGYLVLSYGFSFEYKGRDAFIDEFFLKAPYRSQGIGGKAMDFVASQAKALGIHAIHLEVESHNEKGNRLYARHGYEGNHRRLLTKWLD